MTTPPEDTRAWFRGECLRRFPDQVVAAGWDSLIFDVGRDALQRVPMMEPGRGTRAHVGALLDEVADAAELLDRWRLTRSRRAALPSSVPRVGRRTVARRGAARERRWPDPKGGAAARADEEVETDATETDGPRDLLDDVDELLDEIDDVLEENAEEFVRGYVQKGGQ